MKRISIILLILVFTSLFIFVEGLEKSDEHSQIISPINQEYPRIPLNISHQMSNQFIIEDVESYEIETYGVDSFIEIEDVYLSKNMLDYSNGYWPHSNLTNDFDLNVNNGDLELNYSNGIIARFDQRLNITLKDPRDSINLKLNELNFSYTEDEFALLEIEIKFQVGKYDFYYVFFIGVSNYTRNLFENSYSSSSERYFFIQPQAQYSYNLSYISNDIGSSDPITVKQLTIFGYKPSGLNVSFNLGNIEILQSQNYDSLDSRIFPNSIFLLGNNMTIPLQGGISERFSLTYSQIVKENIVIDIFPNITYQDIFFTSQFSLSNSFEFSKNKISFPPQFIYDRILLNGIEVTPIIDLTLFDYSIFNITFSGKLIANIIDLDFSFYQNRSYSIDNVYNLSIGVFLSSVGEQTIVKISDEIIVDVPPYWSKGTSRIVGYNSSGKAIIYSVILPLIPISAEMSKAYLMNPFQDLSVFYNLTLKSNDTFPLSVSLNQDIPFQYNNTTITFFADSLAIGSHSILVSFSIEGYTPFSVRINIEVMQPNITWDVVVLQRNNNLTLLEITLPLFNNIELPIFVSINDMVKFQIYSSKSSFFVNSSNLELVVTLQIGRYSFLKSIHFPYSVEEVENTSIQTIYSNVTIIKPTEGIKSNVLPNTLIIGSVSMLFLSSFGMMVKLMRKDATIDLRHTRQRSS